MATLTFTIGNVSATVTIPNAKASEMVTNYIASYEGMPDISTMPENPTATQRLTWALRHNAKTFRNRANQHGAKVAGQTAEAEALAAAEAEDWS